MNLRSLHKYSAFLKRIMNFKDWSILLHMWGVFFNFSCKYPKSLKHTYHCIRVDGTKTADVEFTVHGGGVICKHKNINIAVCRTHVYI